MTSAATSKATVTRQPANEPDIYNQFADALKAALRLAMPDTCRTELQEWLAPVAATLAERPISYIVTSEKPIKTPDAPSVFLALGMIAADLLEDEELPVEFYNPISNCVSAIEALVKPENRFQAEGTRLRGAMREYVSLRTGPDNSKQEVPAAAADPQPDSQKVFRRFINATCALFAHPDTPKVLEDAIGDAIRDVGNQLGSYDEYPEVEARRVLSHILRLPEEQVERVQPVPVRAPAAISQPSEFSDMAEALAANLQDDDQLKALIKLVYGIAGESDPIARETMAMTVAERSFTRTCDYTTWIEGVLSTTQRA